MRGEGEKRQNLIHLQTWASAPLWTWLMGEVPAAKACSISSEEKKFHALEDNPDDSGQCEESRTLAVISMRASRTRVEGPGDVATTESSGRVVSNLRAENSGWRDKVGSGNSLFGTRWTTFPRDGICGYECCRGSMSIVKGSSQHGRGVEANPVPGHNSPWGEERGELGR